MKKAQPSGVVINVADIEAGTAKLPPQKYHTDVSINEVEAPSFLPNYKPPPTPAPDYHSASTMMLYGNTSGPLSALAAPAVLAGTRGPVGLGHAGDSPIRGPNGLLNTSKSSVHNSVNLSPAPVPPGGSDPLLKETPAPGMPALPSVSPQ